MIKLFSPTDKCYDTNGDKIIKTQKARVYKEDNGSFYLNLEVSLEYIDDIAKGNILVVNTPQGEQAFRVWDVDKTGKKINAKCKHVFYDTENYLIEDSYIVDKNCEEALNHLNDATSDKSPFVMFSDITDIHSYRCVRNSLKEAIETIIERWGGHLVRDNFNIAIMSSIVQDNGVTVRYKKNLKDISCEENWNDVVTKLMPVGKDGLLLPEKYVCSDIKYDVPFTKSISFSQEINEDNYETTEEYEQALIEDLREQAQEYINSNCIPKMNYKIKVHLNNITDIGDIVYVYDERLSLKLQTTVISYEYDCNLKKYIEIELGNFTKKLSNLVNDITSSASQNTKEQVENASKILNEKIDKNQEEIVGYVDDSIENTVGDINTVLSTLTTVGDD